METAEIKNSLGTIRISDQVIASIAQAATLHVKGIYAMDDRFSHAISSVINDEETRGIRVSIDNKSIVVDLYVAVYHGDRIPAIALNLQEIVILYVDGQQTIHFYLKNELKRDFI